MFIPVLDTEYSFQSVKREKSISSEKTKIMNQKLRLIFVRLFLPQNPFSYPLIRKNNIGE